MEIPVIQVRHLQKSFGQNVVLRDINFDVKKGEVVCIIGSSGSGKSTLLRCINLLETADAGEILYHEQNILDDQVVASTYRTKIGMVFQQFNLFNNLSVLELYRRSTQGTQTFAGGSQTDRTQISAARRDGTVY